MTWLVGGIWRPIVGVLTASAVLLACTQTAPAKKKRTPTDWSDEFFDTEPLPEEPPIAPDYINGDSGAFGAGERPASSSSSSGGSDAGVNPIKTDAGTPPPGKTYCATTGAVAAGDLAIVEIMIASKSGSLDSGEWVEIENTRDCWLKLKGLTVESPRGAAAPNVATVSDDFELPPYGTFVVADSGDPVKNHAIPGKVIAWDSTDVLKNDGDTLTVKMGTVQVDSLTYPAFTNLTPGRALSFPVDCAWTDRANWPRWSLTFTEYSTGFKGTPNAENNDVACF